MGMVNKSIKVIMAAGVLTTALFTAGCGDEDLREESVALNLAYGGYTTASFRLWDLVFPRAFAAVTDLQACFKRLRFKTAEDPAVSESPATDSDNIDFFLGNVTLSGGGTDLGSVTIPAGDYVRIEFDLEDDCGTGYSLNLANGNGVYSTVDRITIKFEGAFTAAQDGTLTMSVQNIMDQLNAYNGVGTLKDAAEAASGEL